MTPNMGLAALQRAGQWVNVLQRYRDITPQFGAIIFGAARNP
jgi:hypothetical protein